MQRNQKYHSNYFSQPNLMQIGYVPPQPFSLIETKMSPRPQLQRDMSFIKENKQNSILMRNSPYVSNQYPMISMPQRQDNFNDMQTYLSSIYGQRKQIKRQQQFSYQQHQQRFRQENIVLPALMIKHNRCLKNRESQQMKKIKQLEDRLVKLAQGVGRQHGCCAYGQQQHMNNMCQCGRGMMSNPIQQSRQPIRREPQSQKKQDNRKSQQNKQQIKQQNKPQNKPQNKKPRLSPQRRKRLLSKFRSAAYAVFFAVIFPHYSYLFGHFKLRQFLTKYLVEQNSHIRKMNLRIEQKFKQIPLYQKIRQIHQQYEQQNDFQSKKRQQDPKIKISNQLTNQNYIINLNIFKRIMSMMVTTYSQFVDQLTEQQLQFLSVGMLNTSYYGDEIYAIEQMTFINCHQQKGNVRVTKKQQKALLLSNFIIKRVVYQNLVRLAVDPQWHEEMATYSQLKKYQRQFFKIICKQIQLCALLMYEMAIKNFYILIDSQSHHGNFLQLADSALPLPVKTMRFPTLFMTGSQKEIFNHGFGGDHMSAFQPDIMQGPYKLNDKKKPNNNSNKKSSNDDIDKQYGSISRFQSKYNWGIHEKEIFEQYAQLIQQDPLNIIHNTSQFSQLSQVISQYLKSSYQKFQSSLLKIVDKLHIKVNQKKRKNYNRIYEKVMKKKYILTKEHEILQGVVFLRNQQQKKLVAMSRKMLQIYQQTLEDRQYEVRDKVGDLASKRQLMRNNISRNGSNKNNKNNKNNNNNNRLNKSMVSIMSVSQSDKNSSFYGKQSQISYKRNNNRKNR